MKISQIFQLILKIERRSIEWKARNGLDILRVSLGIIFIWFGVLKFFHGISPAEVIAGTTIEKLSFGLVKPVVSLPVLAVWECTIGMGLIIKRWISLTLLLLYFQMIGTFLPLVFFPHQTFISAFVPTLLGQYIIKNIVLLSSAVVIGATAKGGKLTAHPKEHYKFTRLQAFRTRFKKKFKEHAIS